MFEGEIPWEYLDPIMQFAAANPRLSAGVVALVASWVLYGVLGKRYLGADDDFWPRIRNTVLPILDQIGHRYGFYAEGESTSAEFAGIVDMGEEQFEQAMVKAGYYRNPLAAVKDSPQGWDSDGSWAKRTGKIRGIGDRLRNYGISHIPFLETYLARFIQAAGDILAIYQIHLTIYTRQRQDGTQQVFVYAHHEFNSLNPITAWLHYTGVGLSAEKGVRLVRQDFQAAGIPIRQAKK